MVMDGMVFDLEAWLPEHPGGATVIPMQALNKDPVLTLSLALTLALTPEVRPSYPCRRSTRTLS